MLTPSNAAKSVCVYACAVLATKKPLTTKSAVVNNIKLLFENSLFITFLFLPSLSNLPLSKIAKKQKSKQDKFLFIIFKNKMITGLK